MTAHVLLELADARVVRDGSSILDIEHLVVREGEHVAVLGPNGAGKSTLVGLLTGDVKALWRDPASVRVRGQRLWDVAEARRRIGVVSPVMHADLARGIRVFDAVAGGLYGTVGLPVHLSVDAGQADRVRRALDRLGVLDLSSRRMSTLSTGEARRVVIARALVAEPEVLVLDEPTAGLDPGASAFVHDAVRVLARSGVTLLLVTHHVEDIVPEVDRVLLLDAGRVVADGPVEELLTGARLSALFGTRLDVVRGSGGWRLV